MNFYNENYEIFSNTRYSIWKSIKEFNNIIDNNSYILDAGCGNGKNMMYLNNSNHNCIGFDNCINLLNICKKKKLDVFNANILNIPLKDNCFNYIICIAVIHHIRTKNERICAVNKLLRILKKDGKLLITVWAYEQEDSKRKFNIGDNIVKFNKIDRYYYIFNKDLFLEFINKFNVEKFYYEKNNWNVIITK